MQVAALACTSCGAPFPPSATAQSSTVACPFCHATMVLTPDKDAIGGPVHFQERITLTRYRELAARPFVFEPKVHPVALTPVAQDEPEPEPKKKRWLFF